MVLQIPAVALRFAATIWHGPSARVPDLTGRQDLRTRPGAHTSGVAMHYPNCPPPADSRSIVAHAGPQPARPDSTSPTPTSTPQRLPVDELAEMRRVAPIWWNEQPMGTGGFDDGGYWVVTRHKDVKEVSRRSDVFSSLEKTALPRYKDGTVAEQLDQGKFVLLNMDAPHHTHLRKIISRMFTPRAVERLRDELGDPGATDRARGCRRRGFGRLRRAGGLRTAAAGHRRADGRAAGGPQEAVRLVQSDGRRHGPGVRRQ